MLVFLKSLFSNKIKPQQINTFKIYKTHAATLIKVYLHNHNPKWVLLQSLFILFLFHTLPSYLGILTHFYDTFFISFSIWVELGWWKLKMIGNEKRISLKSFTIMRFVISSIFYGLYKATIFLILKERPSCNSLNNLIKVINK